MAVTPIGLLLHPDWGLWHAYRGALGFHKTVTGITPARAVERLRVEAARQALGETSHPLKRIARDCGFGSEETMRRSFLRVLAVPPQTYRERFPA